jgi:hypothetical protein
VVYTLAGKGGGNATAAYVKSFGRYRGGFGRIFRDARAAACNSTDIPAAPHAAGWRSLAQAAGRVFRRTESLNHDMRVHFADTPLHARG